MGVMHDLRGLSTGKQLRAFQVALVLKYLLPMQEMQEMWV